MKKIKRILALLVAMVMVMGMTVTASATKVENPYQDKITVTNLSEGVSTEVRIFNIIYLDRDATGNETWQVVDWAKDFVQADAGTGKFVITNKDGLKEAVDQKTAKDADKVETVEGTSCEFTNLPIGAYVVWANDSKGTYGLMVANTYDEDGTYMASKPANVVAKVDRYSVTKDADDKFVHRGQSVEFTIKTQFPAKTKENADGTKTELSRFVVKDEPKGLLINGLPTVTIGGTPVVITEDMVVNTVDDATGMTTSYTIDLSSFIATAQAGQRVEIKYTATVIDEKGYNNGVSVESDTVEYNPPEVVKGFEGNITLTKTNENGEEKLKGAEFSVYKGDTKEEALATNALYFVQVEDGVYKQALNADEEGATQTIVTGDAGTVKVTGLDEGTYWFKETEAPEGYALVTEPKSATIDAGNADKEVSIGEDGSFTFANTKLSSLPSTGGIGTTIFTIAGCAIMIAAAGLFFASRRKAAK